MNKESNLISTTKATCSQAWWYTPVIPILRKLRQEGREFKTSLERSCLKTKQNKTKAI
jgi:hypothetical protein